MQPKVIDLVLGTDLKLRRMLRYWAATGLYGGDAVLRTFAAAARAELRAADVLARWGGEGFLLLLPATDLHEAQRMLRRMAERVGAIRVPDLDVAMRITFSGGVVERSPGEPSPKPSRAPTMPCTRPSTMAATWSSRPDA